MAHGERASRLRGKLREFWSRRGPPGDSVTLPEAVVGFVLLMFILPVACVLMSIDGRRP